MLNGKYLRLERVLESVYRDFKFNTSVDWVDVIEWVGECLALIGAPRAFVDKVTDGNTDLFHPPSIVIENFRGKLPFDVYEIKQARACSDGTFQMMRRTTDTFFSSYFCNSSPDINCNSDLTYKVNNNFIFTSFEEGTVQLAYTAMPSDERGYPLIPDNQKYIEAVKWFIGEKIATQLYLQDKYTQAKYDLFCQNRNWYMGAADTAARIPNADEMEGWKNMLIRLIPDVAAHGSSYRYIGDMEQRFNANNAQ